MRTTFVAQGRRKLIQPLTVVELLLIPGLTLMEVWMSDELWQKIGAFLF